MVPGISAFTNSARASFSDIFFIFAILLISFTVLNSGLLLATNFQAMSQNWGDKLEMNVYLKAEQDGTALKAEVEKNPLVSTVRLLTQADAVKELQTQMFGRLH